MHLLDTAVAVHAKIFSRLQSVFFCSDSEFYFQALSQSFTFYFRHKLFKNHQMITHSFIQL